MSRRCRVLLVRHAPTAATRGARFPADEPLDDRGREQASALADRLPPGRALTSPAKRARITADLAGYDAVVDDRLAEADFGAWSGRSFDEVHADDPDGLAAWLHDPTASLAPLVTAMTDVLEEAREHATTVCFTHGGPIKAAVLTALGAPLTSVWNLDVAPCSVTEMHGRPDGGWTVVAVNR